MAAGMKRASLVFLIALTSVATTGVCAEILADPTRPPAALSTGEATEGPRRPSLQSIIITPQGRAAVIDGQRVELRGRYGDAQVVQITESEVVLRSAGGVQTLKMYPDVEKFARRSDPPRVKVTPRPREGGGTP